MTLSPMSRRLRSHPPEVKSSGDAHSTTATPYALPELRTIIRTLSLLPDGFSAPRAIYGLAIKETARWPSST